MKRGSCATSVLGAALLLAPGGLAGQASHPADGWTDSAAVERALRDDQRALERLRRRHLPPSPPGAAARCDERVGRLCFSHDHPAPRDRDEPDVVRAHRDTLIARLGRTARRWPGARWVVGQYVWQLLQAGRTEEAVRAARACRARPIWCERLEGLAAHEAGRFRAAETAFHRTLDRMPPARRHALTDPAPLVDDPLGDGQRSDFWWLADPLWSVAGSERWTEHMARHVIVDLQRQAATPLGPGWPYGLEELIVRYGWPSRWTRTRLTPRPGSGPRVPVVGHHDASALPYVPPAATLATPARAATWPFDDPEPRATYRPAYLDTLHHPEATRWTRFDRPDSTVLVVSWRTGWKGGPPPEATLRVDAGPDRTLATRRKEVAPDGGRLAVRLPRADGVASLEVIDRAGRRAVRRRVGIDAAPRPEGWPGLSGLLLVAPSASATLEEAIRHVRVPAPARPGDRIGLYWELYGPAARLRGARVTVTLRQQRDGGLLAALAEGLGLHEGETRTVGAGWRMAGEDGRRVHPGRLAVTLPEELEAGAYRLVVEARVDGHEPLRAATDLAVGPE